MSKMDNLRAMREARYAEAHARSAKAAPQQAATAAPQQAATATPMATTTTATQVAKSAPTPDAPTATASETSAEPEAALCGHRAISGRTCTREAGHAAKSHRYA